MPSRPRSLWPALVVVAGGAALVAVLAPNLVRTGDATIPTSTAPRRGLVDVPLEPVDTARAFAAALNAGDVEGVVGLVAPDAGWVIVPGVAPRRAPTPDELREDLASYAELHATLEARSCEERVPGGDPVVVYCRFEYTSDFGKAIGLQPLDTWMAFEVTGGLIVNVFQSPTVTARTEPRPAGTAPEATAPEATAPAATAPAATGGGSP